MMLLPACPEPNADGPRIATGCYRLPGAAASAGAARRFTTAVLGRTHPVLDDAHLVVTELVANAVEHTRSGLPGGDVDVAIDVRVGSVRIGVTDAGRLPAAGTPAVSGSACASVLEGGRGLFLVESFAHTWGFTCHPGPERGCTVWAQLRTPVAAPPTDSGLDARMQD
ncbi:ATP-binding protein [Nocardiopsis trehalosi]|jgi:anti-sigma regulatory factor (Ser/Thr protein kinase)|uniref:ATP-binding protein n=1 Tax=Nocardiopsis trehalosi TaxID=109329 RepID=UPI0012F89813|nr:ATP-binding protein [Nocardiopsis trehalosi]